MICKIFVKVLLQVLIPGGILFSSYQTAGAFPSPVNDETRRETHETTSTTDQNFIPVPVTTPNTYGQEAHKPLQSSPRPSNQGSKDNVRRRRASSAGSETLKVHHASQLQSTLQQHIQRVVSGNGASLTESNCPYHGFHPMGDSYEKSYLLCLPTQEGSFRAIQIECPSQQTFSPTFRRCVTAGSLEKERMLLEKLRQQHKNI